MLYPILKESKGVIRTIQSIMGSYRAQFLKILPVAQKLLRRNFTIERPSTWRLTVYLQFHLLFLTSRLLLGKKVNLGVSPIATSQRRIGGFIIFHFAKFLFHFSKFLGEFYFGINQNAFLSISSGSKL